MFMSRIFFTVLDFLLSRASALAEGPRTPDDVRKSLALTASDDTRDIAAWRPPTGDGLARFVRHRVWCGLDFGKDPILGITRENDKVAAGVELLKD